MSDETARLKNGATHPIAQVATLNRNLKQHVFDSDGVDFQAFKAAVAGPDRVYQGPDVERLKEAGLLAGDGSVPQIVVDIMESIRTPDGHYIPGTAFALTQTDRGR